MYSQCLLYLILIYFINDCQLKQTQIVLHIGGLFDFEYTSKHNGEKEFQAAQLAIDEINSRSKDLFNEKYILKFLSNNSRVNKKILIFICIINLSSVIQSMQLMPFFMLYFVVHNYFFYLVHHVQVKQKLLSRLLIITI